MFCLREYREPENRLPDLLPWAALVAPGVVLQKSCLLQKTIAFRGPDLASSSDSELHSAVSRLNNALKRLGSGWALFCEAQRFEANDYPDAHWPEGVSLVVDLERRQQFLQAGNHFESSYFLTFVYQLQSGGAKKIEALFFESEEDDSKSRKAVVRDNERDLNFFTSQVKEIVGLMQGVFTEVSELDDDQTLTYLHSTISTNRHFVKSPPIPMYLDALLPDQPFTPGHIPMLGEHFMPTISFTGFPNESFPGLLDDLNHLGVPYRWGTRFIYLSKQDAQKELEKYRKRWWQKRKTIFTLIKEEASQQESALINSAAVNKSADADAALQELGEDLAVYGYMTVTVTVWDRELETAKNKIEMIRNVIQSKGFTVKEETFNSKEAWLGSLPGHVYANVRRPLLHTLNLAHIMPLSATWAGDHVNSHLLKESGVGTSHLLTSTVGQTPFHLNLNVGDVGHTLIVGPTGAGKSTLLCLLELQWLKYPGAQVIIFDKDRSARSATLGVQGNIFEPGNEEAPVAFQPLAGIDKKSEKMWAAEFIVNLLRAQNFKETPEVKKEILSALDNLVSTPRMQRTMTVFCSLVQDVDIRNALLPYTLEGTYGQLFDADHDDLHSSFWTMFEMRSLMDLGEEAIIPALDYLFHRIEGSFDGRPTLLVLDEAWLFLSHPVFVTRIKNWLKTLRKKNAYVVFASQEVADAMDSPIMSTILSACQTKIFLPDEEALSPAMMKMYAELGLSDAEIRIISQAQKKRQYYYRSVKGRRLFDLMLGPVALTFAGMSSEEDHHLMDQLEKEFSGEHFAEELLLRQGLQDAAKLVREFRKSHLLKVA
ncbi:MAG: conjugal transfer protein TrbE [Desulfobulbaceae bacterium]|nr:conjugal transfer protein TrbE [Desulfobulbaceae bacterium]